MESKLVNRIENYCAYQERSQQEVRDKLYEWGLFSQDVEQMIAQLIENNFLNEERFALAYAGGKFRIKQWGRIRIKQGLKLKKVPEKLIAKALNSLDEAEYRKTLQVLLEKKEALLKEPDPFKRKNRLMQYAYGKGFEPETISEVLKDEAGLF